jgi:DNA repair protein RadC
MKKIHGLGEAKACAVKAALEISKRLSRELVEERYKIKSPMDVANLVMVDMAFLDHEEMRVVVLDSKNHVIENQVRYRGTVNSSVLRIAEIFRPAIACNSPGIIVCHNHPSGDPEPSPEDIKTTEQLVEAGKILQIELVDHIIIGSHCFKSMKDYLNWK